MHPTHLWLLQEGRTHKVWPIAQVSELHHARYLLQPQALELFMHDRASALLSFQTPKVRKLATVDCSLPGARPHYGGVTVEVLLYTLRCIVV